MYFQPQFDRHQPSDHVKKKVKAPFGYPGGKYYYQELISGLFPDHIHFVDVFGGAGNMVLNSQARVRTYNDIDSEMVNLFKVIGSPNGEDFERFVTLIEQTPHARESFEASKLINHELVNDPVVKAHATFVKFGQSMVGNCKFWALSRNDNRANSRWRDLSSRERIDAIRNELKTIQIEHDDGLKLISRYDTDGALLYLDPPYVTSTRGGRLYKNEMDDQKHKALVDAALNVQNAFVVISGYDNPIYAPLVNAGWLKVHFDAVERISNATGSTPKNDRKRTETLWFSPNCDHNQVEQAISLTKASFNVREADEASTGQPNVFALSEIITGNSLNDDKGFKMTETTADEIKTYKKQLKMLNELQAGGIAVPAKEIARLTNLIESSKQTATVKRPKLDNILSKTQAAKLDDLISDLKLADQLLPAERSISLATALKFFEGFKAFAKGEPVTASELGDGTAIALKAYITAGAIVPSQFEKSRERFYYFSDEEADRLKAAIS